MRQWKRNTEGFTDEQLRSKFYQFDVNGDGRLNHKEFRKLLLSFGIKMNDSDQDTLINRFDVDHDGDIDMHEFFSFIEGEKESLHLDPQHEADQLKRVIRGTSTASTTSLYGSSDVRGGDESYSRSNPREMSRGSSSASLGGSRGHSREGAEHSQGHQSSRGNQASQGYGSQGRGRGQAPPQMPLNRPEWDSSPPRRRPLVEADDSDASVGGRGGSGHRGKNSSKNMTENMADRGTGGTGRPPRYGGSQRVTRRDEQLPGRSERSRGERGAYESDRDYRVTREEREEDDDDESAMPPSYSNEEKDEKEEKERDFDIHDEDLSNEEALWATKMLRAQTHVESKLGRSYY